MYLSFYGAVSSFAALYLSFYGGKSEFRGVHLSFYDGSLNFYGVLGVISVSPGGPGVPDRHGRGGESVHFPGGVAFHALFPGSAGVPPAGSRRPERAGEDASAPWEAAT